MYQKIPNEIKPSETTTMIAYANAFEAYFSLLLRERRSPNLAIMQESAIEVESNMLAADRLNGESNRGVRDKKNREMKSIPLPLGNKHQMIRLKR